MPKSSVSLKFADGEYLFALPAKRIYEIEDACGTGLGAIYARTLRGRFPMMGEDVPHSGALPTEADFKFRELVVVIQQALIGGGRGSVRGESVTVDQYRANDLIDRYILNDGDDRTILTEVWKLAAVILITLVEGFVPPKKKRGRAGDKADPAERLDWPGYLANCAMMGYSKADAETLTWHEMQGLPWNWNERHALPEPEEAEAPPAEYVAARMARLAQSGIARSIH